MHFFIHHAHSLLKLSLFNVFWPRDLSRELRDFYAAVFLRNFALGLIVVFEPIYLYRAFGESFPMVLLYFAATSLIFGLLAPLGAFFAKKFGEKNCMIFSFPFLMLFYAALWKIEAAFFLLVPLSIIFKAAHDILFWPAFHLNFLKLSSQASRGRQYGFVSIFSLAAAASAPLFGGLILATGTLGFPALFGLVLLLIFFSSLIFLRTPEIYADITQSYGRTWQLIFSGAFWKQALALLAQGGESVIMLVVWPVFLFAIAVSFQDIGVMVAAANIVGLALILIIGRLTDSGRAKKILNISSWGLALGWLGKTMTQAYTPLFFLHSSVQFFRWGASIPFMAITYNYASEEKWHKEWFIIFREVTHNCGKAFVLLFMVALFGIFSGLEIKFSFVLAAIFALLLRII